LRQHRVSRQVIVRHVAPPQPLSRPTRHFSKRTLRFLNIAEMPTYRNLFYQVLFLLFKAPEPCFSHIFSAVAPF
jgi:hypothetical protein